MVKRVIKVLIVQFVIFGCFALNAQGLVTDGKKIVNKYGEEVLLRGVGPGGWQVMEGYMMQTSGVAGSQHEIKEKLIDLMGTEKTESFFKSWRQWHFTQQDVDSLASWGFNSIRIPMHYNLFTLPIEAEPIPGENTWIETGFQLIDSVLRWSKPHNIYVILDLHAAPGGQGAGSEINDYDPDKPSLWESQANKDKTVALWQRIADRYKDEEWIGGYDLINEPHWNLPEGTALRALYEEITAAIRTVDTNHILFIEGNWYANDFTGLTPPWDDNMVYSFHKYWSYNSPNDLDWVLPLREQHNVPLWMGESGENSNTWFTDAVSLFERNNIGWAWWTMRKIGDIDRPYAIEINPGYQKVIDYWKGEGPKPTEEEAYNAMMNLVENLKVEHSLYRKDVPDALIRQPHTDETIPYHSQVIPGRINTSDFDLGKNGIAYFDTHAADYNLSTGSFQAWNSGWEYRNDGVDIESNDDPESNGYNVGFTEKGEWINYTVEVKESGVYNARFRIATASDQANLHLGIDGRSITPVIPISGTGGWQSYEYKVVNNILLEEGIHVLTLYFDDGSVNISGITFEKTGSSEELDFRALTAEAGKDEKSIILTFNYPLKEIIFSENREEFEVFVNNQPVSVDDITQISLYSINIKLTSYIYYLDKVSISYSGAAGLESVEGAELVSFEKVEVINKLPVRVQLPSVIQAETFDTQLGFGTEETSDLGGGLNLGYSNTGDYADYMVFAREDAHYEMSLRIAAQNRSGVLGVYRVVNGNEEVMLGEFSIPITGGWQQWQTITGIIELPGGAYTLRIKVLQPEFNINWFSFKEIVLNIPESTGSNLFLYPNPTSDYFHIRGVDHFMYSILNASGRVLREGFAPMEATIDVRDLQSGIYFVSVRGMKNGNVTTQKLIKQ